MSLIPPSFQLATVDDLKQASDGIVRWIWRGYLAQGSLTLLTSRWKSGKTTLLSLLLAGRRRGGELAGATVTPGPTIVVSEEAPQVWVERARRLRFSQNTRWCCQPFLHKPSRAEWEQLVKHLARVDDAGPPLVVIDPLAAVLPGGDENNAASILAALAPLRTLTAKGAAVLLLHHPSKASADPRGSGALASFADVLMQLDMPDGAASDTRRRVLRARSRLQDAPAEQLLELNAEGTSYRVCDADAEAGADGWSTIRWVLSDAWQKMTRSDIRDEWPEGRDKPSPAAVWKWLEAACAAGHLRRDGRGRKHKPFRYWLPDREPYFLPDLPDLEPPMGNATLEEDLAFARKVVEQDIVKRERKRRARANVSNRAILSPNGP